jgi:hypothetical protein
MKSTSAIDRVLRRSVESHSGCWISSLTVSGGYAHVSVTVELPSSMATALRVLDRLVEISEGGCASRSVELLADDLGLRFSTCRRAVQRLLQDGLIRRLRAGSAARAAVYQITATTGPDGWTPAQPSDRQMSA